MLPLYKKIKMLRIKNDMSQDKLAELAGYTSRSTIAKIESGKIDIPQSKIKVFSDIFNVTPGYLMDWDNTDSPLGDYTKNVEHLKNEPELLALYEDILENDNLAILFDKARSLSPSDLEQILRIIDTFDKETK